MADYIFSFYFLANLTFLWYSYTATTELVPAVSTTLALGQTQVST